MTDTNALWVLGHKITPLSISGNYDMVIGETPSEMSGPPPHYHAKYSEVFLVIEGEMEFVIDGKVKTVKKGESVDLPPNVLHTFSNNSEMPCKWVNIHSPKGFFSFFKEMGVPLDNSNALKESLKDEIIQKVMQTAAQYDMHIKL